MIDYPTLVGLIAGGIMTFSVLPQTLKLYKTKSSRDVSMLYTTLAFIGTVGWLYYGILRGDGAIMLWNGIGTLLVGATLALKVKYDLRK
jgi:MtN3 and saliva related transmembrane protein